VHPLDTVTVTLPVKRIDVEATRLNNGRYLTLMDIGRYALIVRCGYLPAFVKNRWYPLVLGVSIRYRKSLRVGTNFDLSTRLLCWDERNFFLEQTFLQNGEQRAQALVKAIFLGQGKVVPTQRIVDSGPHRFPSPEFPEAVRAWQSALRAMETMGQ
jgi:acyl-CoA thioesterase FadM